LTNETFEEKYNMEKLHTAGLILTANFDLVLVSVFLVDEFFSFS